MIPFRYPQKHIYAVAIQSKMDRLLTKQRSVLEESFNTSTNIQLRFGKSSFTICEPWCFGSRWLLKWILSLQIKEEDFFLIDYVLTTKLFDWVFGWAFDYWFILYTIPFFQEPSWMPLTSHSMRCLQGAFHAGYKRLGLWISTGINCVSWRRKFWPGTSSDSQFTHRNSGELWIFVKERRALTEAKSSSLHILWCCKLTLSLFVRVSK